MEAKENALLVEQNNESQVKNGLFVVKGGKIYAFWKRVFDLLSSLILTILISPLLIVVIIVSLFYFKGHVFYKDVRVGKNGKDFSLLKFRSMYLDANDHPEKYLNESQMKQFIEERKVDNDPRITKLGKFLRKTSLDELPQLFNIILGSMSVVGPRPIARSEMDEHYSANEQKVLLCAKPGLTGYWQVYGRGKATYDSGLRVNMELEYFKKRSLWFDFVLILKTIPSVAKHKGAK
jgi:lipopolysaccharide/colanic/teichoic acid biosynthesis glycosyltransferase